MQRLNNALLLPPPHQQATTAVNPRSAAGPAEEAGSSGDSARPGDQQSRPLSRHPPTRDYVASSVQQHAQQTATPPVKLVYSKPGWHFFLSVPGHRTTAPWRAHATTTRATYLAISRSTHMPQPCHHRCDPRSPLDLPPLVRIDVPGVPRS